MTTSTPTRRRLTLAAAGCATAAAVAAGSMTTGFGQADAAASSIGGGVAIVPPLTSGTAVAVGPGSMAVATGLPSLLSNNGEATSIALLPLSFAGTYAGPNQSATAFAIIGLAGATAPDLLGAGNVNCLGALTFAHSSTAGTCLNILGAFDFRHNSQTSTLQFGLTNPIGLLTGDVGLGDVLSGIPTGNLDGALTPDIVRLSMGGSNLITLTSGYGFQRIAGTGYGVEFSWLGTTLQFFPAVQVNGQGAVNYIGLPGIQFGLPSSIGDIIPSLRTGAFALPFNITIPGINTSDLLPLSEPTGSSATLAGVQNDLGGVPADGPAERRANTAALIEEQKEPEPTTLDTVTGTDGSVETESNLPSGTGDDGANDDGANDDGANDDGANDSAPPTGTAEITSGDNTAAESDEPADALAGPAE
ncbi:hypothetical protein [Gordonia iterans]